MEFIRGITLVHLKIRCWSGEKKASRSCDISLGKDGTMPPKNLLNLGRKKIFPPRAIDPLIRQRKSAERACLAIGTRFMGGYAIPDGEIDDLVIALNHLDVDFQSAKATFMSNFESNKQKWLDENKEFAHVIKGQVPERKVVENAFEFSFKLFKMDPLEGFELDGDEIANQVLHEVGMTCKEMSNRMLDRKTAIGGKTLIKQLQPLIQKLDQLSFGNGRILKVLDEFKQLSSSIPEERLDSQHQKFGHTVTFLTMCSSPEKLERIINGQFSVSELLFVPENIVEEEQSTSTTINPTIAPTRVVTSAYF